MAATDISGILQRIVGASGHSMSAEVAHYFLGISFTPADLEQIAALSEKANEGTISPAEQEELRTYVFLNDFLAAMQARARASLRQQSPAA